MLGEVIRATIVLAIMGGVFGISLNVTSHVLCVKMDECVVNVLNTLPGVNCEACGLPGRESLTNATVADEAMVNACAIDDQEVTDKVADVVGVNAESIEREVAVVRCQSDCSKVRNKYSYEGLIDCRLINDHIDGFRSCGSGCLGGGTCVAICEFDAIHAVDRIAQADREKCVACRKCIDICPKNIIGLMPYKQKTEVKCSTKDPGKIVRTNRSTGYTACKLCEENRPEDAIHVEDNLTKVDYDKCISCSTCAARCPIGAVFVECPERVEKIREAAKRKAAAAAAKKKEEMAVAQAKAAARTLEKEAEK